MSGRWKRILLQSKELEDGLLPEEALPGLIQAALEASDEDVPERLEALERILLFGPAEAEVLRPIRDRAAGEALVSRVLVPGFLGQVLDASLVERLLPGASISEGTLQDSLRAALQGTEHSREFAKAAHRAAARWESASDIVAVLPSTHDERVYSARVRVELSPQAGAHLLPFADSAALMAIERALAGVRAWLKACLGLSLGEVGVRIELTGIPRRARVEGGSLGLPVALAILGEITGTRLLSTVAATGCLSPAIQGEAAVESVDLAARKLLLLQEGRVGRMLVPSGFSDTAHPGLLRVRRLSEAIEAVFSEARIRASLVERWEQGWRWLQAARLSAGEGTPRARSVAAAFLRSEGRGLALAAERGIWLQEAAPRGTLILPVPDRALDEQSPLRQAIIGWPWGGDLAAVAALAAQQGTRLVALVEGHASAPAGLPVIRLIDPAGMPAGWRQYQSGWLRFAVLGEALDIGWPAHRRWWGLPLAGLPVLVWLMLPPQLSPQTQEALQERAFAAGCPAGAALLDRELLDEHPDAVAARLWRAHARACQEDAAVAIRAFLEAGAREPEVLLELSMYLAELRRWSALAALLERLDASDPEVVALRERLDTATWRLPSAHPLAGLVKTERHALSLASVDLDQDGTGELALLGRDGLTLVQATPELPALYHQPPAALHPPREGLAVEGAVRAAGASGLLVQWMVAPVDRHDVRLYSWGSGTLVGEHSWLGGRIVDVAELDERGLYLANTDETRDLLRLAADGSLSQPSPTLSASNSVVTALEVLEVGDEEMLVVGAAEWGEYAVRLMSADASGQLRTLWREQVGLVQQILRLDDGLLVGVGGALPNPVAFPELDGHLPPPSLIRFEPTPDGMKRVAQVPPPVSGVKGVSFLERLEVDGGALILAGFHTQEGPFSWLLDADSLETIALMEGLYPQLAAELDGDPEPELVLTDRDDRVWLAGIAGPADLLELPETFDPGPAPEGVSERSWWVVRWLGRTGELLSARSLLESLSDEEPAGLARHRAALAVAAGDVESAAEDYLDALDLLTADEQSAARAVFEQTLQLEAVAAAGGAALAESDWQDVAADGLPWYRADPLRFFTDQPGTIWLEAIALRSLLAELPVRAAGDHHGVAVELELLRVEWGSGLSVQLDAEQGRLAWARVQAEGGGGVLIRKLVCGTPGNTERLLLPVKGAEHREKIRIELESVPALGRTRCLLHREVDGRWQRIGSSHGQSHERPVALAVREEAAGDGLRMLDARISRMSLRGLEVRTDGPALAPSPTLGLAELSPEQWWTLEEPACLALFAGLRRDDPDARQALRSLGTEAYAWALLRDADLRADRNSADHIGASRQLDRVEEILDAHEAPPALHIEHALQSARVGLLLWEGQETWVAPSEITERLAVAEGLLRGFEVDGDGIGGAKWLREKIEQHALLSIHLALQRGEVEQARELLRPLCQAAANPAMTLDRLSARLGISGAERAGLQEVCPFDGVSSEEQD